MDFRPFRDDQVPVSKTAPAAPPLSTEPSRGWTHFSPHSRCGVGVLTWDQHAACLLVLLRPILGYCSQCLFYKSISTLKPMLSPLRRRPELSYLSVPSATESEGRGEWRNILVIKLEDCGENVAQQESNKRRQGRRSQEGWWEDNCDTASHIGHRQNDYCSRWQ